MGSQGTENGASRSPCRAECTRTDIGRCQSGSTVDCAEEVGDARGRGGQPSGGGRGPEELWKQSSDRGLPRSEERACAGKLKAEFLPSVEDPKGAWPQQLRGMGGWPGVHCPVMDSETFSLVKGTRQNLLRLLYRTGLKQFGMSPVVGK